MSNTMGTPHPYDVDFTTGPREFLGDKGLNKGNVGAPNVKPAARAEELLQAGISSKGASNVLAVRRRITQQQIMKTASDSHGKPSVTLFVLSDTVITVGEAGHEEL